MRPRALREIGIVHLRRVVGSRVALLGRAVCRPEPDEAGGPEGPPLAGGRRPAGAEITVTWKAEWRKGVPRRAG